MTPTRCVQMTLLLLFSRVVQGKCIIDPLLESAGVREINEFLSAHQSVLHSLFILNSFVIDAGIVLHLVWYMWRGQNTALFYAFFCFCHFRGLCILSGKWPQTPYYIVSDPGFPSLMVPYEPTNDYYFSGHCTTMTLLFLGFVAYFGQHYGGKAKGHLSVVSSENILTAEPSEMYLIEEHSRYEEQFILLTENKAYRKVHYSSEAKDTECKPRVPWWAWALRVVYGVGVLQTVGLLIVTSFHYTNDVLIGLVVGGTMFGYCHRYRYSVTYFLLVLYCKAFSKR